MSIDVGMPVARVVYPSPKSINRIVNFLKKPPIEGGVETDGGGEQAGPQGCGGQGKGGNTPPTHLSSEEGVWWWLWSGQGVFI